MAQTNKAMPVHKEPLLEDKVALVTGGSQGIGTAIVLDFASHGADVAFTYRRHEEEAKQIAAQVEAMGRRALPLKADVSVFADSQAIVDKVVEELGGLDILINNAGMNWDGVIWKMTEEQWDRVISVDLKGCFNYIRAAAPIFREQAGGKIVNITSINGLRGKFGQSNYSAAKGGVIALTKTVAREMGRSSVNVNAVAPGLIETAMVKEAPEKVREMALAEIVLGRLGLPEEVASVVTFLCSESARHITGEVITVDGGQYL
jgi:3-oxoacyl-[acyl-carrier protein] reductase